MANSARAGSFMVLLKPASAAAGSRPGAARTLASGLPALQTTATRLLLWPCARQSRAALCMRCGRQRRPVCCARCPARSWARRRKRAGALRCARRRRPVPCGHGNVVAACARPLPQRVSARPRRALADCRPQAGAAQLPSPSRRQSCLMPVPHDAVALGTPPSCAQRATGVWLHVCSARVQAAGRHAHWGGRCAPLPGISWSGRCGYARHTAAAGRQQGPEPWIRAKS